jgi:hypothetical protein
MSRLSIMIYINYATFIVCLDAQSLTRTIPEVVATATYHLTTQASVHYNRQLVPYHNGTIAERDTPTSQRLNKRR